MGRRAGRARERDIEEGNVKDKKQSETLPDTKEQEAPKVEEETPEVLPEEGAIAEITPPEPVEAEIVDDSPLSNDERKRLSFLENEVARGFETAGKALREIQERRLYRPERVRDIRGIL